MPHSERAGSCCSEGCVGWVYRFSPGASTVPVFTRRLQVGLLLGMLLGIGFLRGALEGAVEGIGDGEKGGWRLLRVFSFGSLKDGG